MLIRKASNADIDELIKLRLEFFKVNYGEYNEKTEELLINQMKEYFPKHIGDDFIGYLAVEDNKIMATIYMVINERPGNLSFINGKTGILLNVYTRPEFRRRGLAEKLVNEAIKDAKKMDLSFVELKASKMGYPLYKKVGFDNDISETTPMIYTIQEN